MQRLLITISLLAFMFSGCGGTPTDLARSNDATLGGTVVDSDEGSVGGGMDETLNPAAIDTDDSVVLDSDGDGFSNDEEVNFIPGTDPFDATDNPNDVRDTDGDGCSDYDELTLEGFCDNDPNTPASDAAPACAPICAQGFCDSDCDGWFDVVEVDGGFDPCDPIDPPFSSDNPATICTTLADGAEDTDGDGVPDATDNCLLVANTDQRDSDNNGVGEACTLVFDFDGDGIPDEVDNCLLVANSDQLDLDGNGTGDACDVVLPPATLTISGIYGSDALELSDGSVWDITFGFTFGWFVGDRVTVDFSSITNLDEDANVTASNLGTAIAHSSIWQVANAGQFLDLLDGTSWEIDLLDRLWVQLWLPADSVVVVQDLFSYYLVRKSDGRVVGGIPLP